ncbi:FERM, ARHGEF and pleckstrin domain-containing protein 2 [Ciona intestinalis]
MPHSSATVRVQMLDHSVHTYDVKVKSYGNMLLQSVMKDINLLESDYFGIQYTDKQGNRVFLDPLKKIKSQITNISNVVLHFVVRFFPPDPGQLQEEYTRYLFALQVKQDIVDGLLPCNENTLVVMASYIAQSEFGDWNSFDCSDLSYLRDLKLLPPLVDMNEHDLLVKVSENHKIRTGETKADSDYHLLDIVRRLEQYGLRLLPAKDQENTDIKLAVAHMGVVVFRGNSKINTFNWARIRKLSFKKKRFLIKLRTETSVDKNGQNVGDILVFVMASRDTCKNFWRHCIEYHAFFRLEIHPDPAPKPKIIKRGSTFRYSGKTQKQLHELVRNSNFRRTTFVRASARKPTIQPNNRTPQFNSPAITVTPSVISTEHDDSGIPSPIKTEAEVNGHVTTTPDLTIASKGDGLVYSQKEEKPEELSPSSMATAAWQVESEHLHSSVVSVPSHETPDEAPDTTAQTAESQNESKSAEQAAPLPSPVNLHSGGMSDPNDLTEVSALSVNGSVASSVVSPPGLLSTRGLKSTSSLSSETRYPSSQAYYIAKEMLTTERTYVKDLEVITTWFKSALQKEGSESLLPENTANQLFGGIGSLVALHQQFLCTLDDRLSSWEGRGSTGATNDQLVDDLMLSHMLVLKKYLASLENGESLITAIEEVGDAEPKFESLYREFELQKVCYLPFNSFLLKPMQRIAHYKLITERLMNYYEAESTLQQHPELQSAYKEASVLCTATQERLKRAHNLQKMAQLRRDLIGVEHLLKPNRTFIREGSLYKLSRKGFQQRLFFLFSDCLVYTSKGVTSTNQFKVHAELPLQGMIIEVNEGESAVPNCFSILSASKTVIVAAATQEEMDKWLEDFSVAIARAGREMDMYESPLNNAAGSLSRLSMEQSSEDGEGSVRNSMERLKPPMQHRSNATMHVCWHRNTSVSSSDHLVSLKNQLSGYLLRKFKNSNGWQKLWVVFTNFCLFFYKSNQDESPLASLPLLGYTINSPTEADGIRKDFVFKLKFKTHVYFFRAESQYTYNRWIEVISSATVTSQRTRLFSRMDSYQ